MNLEHFNDWLERQFQDIEKRELTKKLILDYLASLEEHELLYQLNNYSYWKIYGKAMEKLIIE